jgi:S1-C subfamily serine protease
MKNLRGRIILIFCSAIVVLLLTPFLIQAQTARQIAQNTFPSVVLLVMEDANSQPVSLGSGFFVREDVIATNLHVIEGAAKGYAKLIGQKTKYDIAGTVGIDIKRELVLLSVKETKAPSLQLGDSSQVAVGDEVYAVGNPQGLEGTFSQGIISGIRQVDSEAILQITAPVSPGSSGGPVLNTNGKVIGVAVATFKGGQNLNFAIPVSYLTTLLENIKPVTVLSTKTRPKQDKSITDDFSGKSVEGVAGVQLIWQNYFLGAYSFSLKNQLRESVKDVYCLVIFYDRSNNPIDVDVIRYDGVIPAGLAKRVTSRVDNSVYELTTNEGSLTPSTKIEFRVLDFKIVE